MVQRWRRAGLLRWVLIQPLSPTNCDVRAGVTQSTLHTKQLDSGTLLRLAAQIITDNDRTDGPNHL
jgi:hypothetical protein